MSDPCCFESLFSWVILVSFCMLIFSVLGRKDWFFVSLSVSKRSYSFLSLLLYLQACWTIFFLFCAWLFEILDLTFIEKKHLFSALHALELDLFGNISEIIFPLSFYASFQAWKDRNIYYLCLMFSRSLFYLLWRLFGVCCPPIAHQQQKSFESCLLT